jgi:hypothetical protein
VNFIHLVPSWLHQAGTNLNEREMGGEDAGVFSAMSNCMNRADGILAPFITVCIKNLTGSWIPVFYLGIAGYFVKLALYWCNVSVKPARVLYAEQTGLRSW